MAAPFDHAGFTSQAKQGWSSAASGYDRISAELFAPITSSFLAFTQLAPGQLVLDLACGTGALTTAAARAVGPTGRVVGVDLAPAMLKIAMSRADGLNLEYREMNAEELDFPDGVFQQVVCQLGLMLFARPQAALQEMTRVCKKGGSVACLVQGDPQRMLFTSLVNNALSKHAPELKQPGAPGLYAFGAVGVLDQALANAGLRHVVSSRMAGAFDFASPEEYWKIMTDGAGRTGALLQKLPEPKRRAVEEDVLARAATFNKEGRLAIPYEVVMARGLKS